VEKLNQYGWFGTFCSLANYDILKINEVSKTPLYQALAFLSYEAARSEYMNNLQKQ
jgi:hypothetical protein